MDKNAIKKYAVWARQELITRVAQRAAKYCITEKEMVSASAESVNGTLLTATEKRQRSALISQISHKGYNEVIEEVAYTWFNRFTALRFMEVNGYLPNHVRVFTDDNNAFHPQILTEAINLELNGLDMEKVFALKNANSKDELFKYLVITLCNSFSSILPEMFQKIDDYTELLFPDNLLREGSVIEKMIALINEEDWKDKVQIIGWLYQYYNSEPKDKVFADLKKNVKISKENIPAATQLFTPDWIVRYMVENSLGRLWVDGHSDFDKSEWKYYLEEAEQEESVKAQLDKLRADSKNLSPEDIKFIDPCMGSGHIIVYAFDVLMQIYLSQGYTERDATSLIVTKNLFGADIDKRAYQLAYFALMMKARQYDRRFLTREIKPNLCNLQDIAEIDASKLTGELGAFARQFADCDTYGSLIEVQQFDTDKIKALIDDYEENLDTIGYTEFLPKMLGAYKIFAQKYDVCCTNPPYMGSSGMNVTLTDYVKEKYHDSKSDLFAVFIERCGQLAKANGFYAMITQHAWMFLSSYEKLRENLMLKTTVNMAHLGARAFDEIGGEVVQTTAFVNYNSHIAEYKGTYARLVDIVGENEKKEAFLGGEYRHTAKQENFSKIPGAPVAYWVSENFVKAFENTICGKTNPRMGLTTGQNDKYLRQWFEVNYSSIGFGYEREQAKKSMLKWFPYNKGGLYRKWYGNQDYIVNWYNDGIEMQTNMHPDGNRVWAHNFNLEWNFTDHLCWNDITSGNISFRYFPKGFLFDSSAAVSFVPKEIQFYLLGFLNTKFVNEIAKLLNPTMHFKLGDFENLPYLIDETRKTIIDRIVEQNITISKSDWDSYETSWDFKRHPFLENMSACGYADEDIDRKFTVESSFSSWKYISNQRFTQLKKNEEELNRIFIDIYGLQDELTPEVEDKDVTVHYIVDTKDDIPESLKGSNYVRTKRDEIVSLISYAVGCMFGRYSIYKDGLIFAGEKFSMQAFVDKMNERSGTVSEEEIIRAYHDEGVVISDMYAPDPDNCIPITDEEYFEDDIVGRFVDYIRVVYGEDSLEQNLDFIAQALGNRGNTSRQVIRNYFLNDFFNDHCKIYQKRPIYWLFDSGKKNGFKALIYMHRYQPDTVARIRTDYVHEQQSRYRTALADLETRIASASTAERVKLGKQQKTIREQAEELHQYEEKIHHLADQMIAIDLDDGVKVNYSKFQEVLAKIK